MKSSALRILGATSSARPRRSSALGLRLARRRGSAYREGMDGPTAQQIDLFRAVEDIHELTAAIVILLTDRDGVAVAVAGDEDD